MKVNLRTQSVSIRAPRSAVFELISSFGDAVDGSGPSGKPEENEESKRLIERDGNRLLMEFRSQDGRKMYRTLEEVVYTPKSGSPSGIWRTRCTTPRRSSCPPRWIPGPS